MRRAFLATALLVAACGGDDGGGDERVVRLLTHDSFAVSDDVLAAFTESTGIDVVLVQGGDAGAMVNQAILTAGNPQGDVLYGIDTTFLALGLDEDLFEPYESPELEHVPDELEVDPGHRVTPIDTGDVCLNIDRSFFDAPGAPPPPASIDDLTDPAYADLLVVEDPATSSPGLAFLAATVEVFGIAQTQLDLPPDVMVVPGDSIFSIKEDEILNLKIYVSDPNGDDDVKTVGLITSDTRIPGSVPLSHDRRFS